MHRRHRRRVEGPLCTNDLVSPVSRRAITVSTAKARLKEVYRVHCIRHRSLLANSLMLEELVSDGYEQYIGFHLDRISCTYGWVHFSPSLCLSFLVCERGEDP